VKLPVHNPMKRLRYRWKPTTTSKDLPPLTSAQTVQLRRDLTLVEERLQDIAILMRISYGRKARR
jgi:hypothetical protein